MATVLEQNQIDTILETIISKLKGTALPYTRLMRSIKFPELREPLINLARDVFQSKRDLEWSPVEKYLASIQVPAEPDSDEPERALNDINKLVAECHAGEREFLTKEEVKYASILLLTGVDHAINEFKGMKLALSEMMDHTSKIADGGDKLNEYRKLRRYFTDIRIETEGKIERCSHLIQEMDILLSHGDEDHVVKAQAANHQVLNALKELLEDVDIFWEDVQDKIMLP